MHQIDGLGIGLAAAFLQATSYLLSARFSRKSGLPSLRLLGPSFVLMGCGALALSPFAIPAGQIPWMALLPASALCIAFCMAGNGAMFILLKEVDSSRASPLLALKVPMLCIACVVVLGDTASLLQITAVTMVIGSAFLLSGAGRPIPAKGWFWLLFACACFSISDWFIKRAIDAATQCSPTLASATMLALCCIYVVGAIFGIALTICVGNLSRSGWIKHALPYSAVWFAAMVALFLCFASCDLVLGNIVQSTRGLISIVLGWLVARSGRTELEEKVGAGMMARRILAALLVVAAMALYAIGRASAQ